MRKRGRNLKARVRKRQRQERRVFGEWLHRFIEAIREAGHDVYQPTVSVGSLEERVQGPHRRVYGRRRS